MYHRHARRILKYLITGGSAALVEFGLFILLVHTGLPLVLSNVISFSAGFITSFLMNRQWVFKANGRTVRQLSLYGILAAANVVLSSSIIYILTSHASVIPSIAKVMTMGLIVLWNYILFSKVIFAERNKPAI